MAILHTSYPHNVTVCNSACTEAQKILDYTIMTNEKERVLNGVRP